MLESLAGICWIGMDARQRIRFCKAADGVRIAYAECGEGRALVRVCWLRLHRNHLARYAGEKAPALEFPARPQPRLRLVT